MKLSRDDNQPGSALPSVQEGLSTRVNECISVDPDTQRERCSLPDITTVHDRDVLMLPQDPLQEQHTTTAVRSCCGGPSRQDFTGPNESGPCLLVTEILCTTMSEAELQEIDIIAVAEEDSFDRDQLVTKPVEDGIGSFLTGLN